MGSGSLTSFALERNAARCACECYAITRLVTFCVLAYGLKNFEVSLNIICGVMVLMVDHFMWQQQSSEHAFGNQSMFQYPPAPWCAWMVGSVAMPIAVFVVRPQFTVRSLVATCGRAVFMRDSAGLSARKWLTATRAVESLGMASVSPPVINSPARPTTQPAPRQLSAATIYAYPITHGDSLLHNGAGVRADAYASRVFALRDVSEKAART